MITLKDIFKAACNHISEVTGLPLVDGDLEEPVIRPSFKIFMDTVNTGFFSSALRYVKVYFNIYFYSSDRKNGKSEIMDIEDKISYSFLEPFEIKETCCVYVDDLEFEKVKDGVLNCSFNFEIATEFISRSEKQTELENGNGLMEDLYINENLEEEM